MNGAEQMTVWLAVSLLAAVAACRVAYWLAAGRAEVARQYATAQVEMAKAQVEVHRIAVEAQHGPMFVPQEWNPREGL